VSLDLRIQANAPIEFDLAQLRSQERSLGRPALDQGSALLAGAKGCSLSPAHERAGTRVGAKVAAFCFEVRLCGLWA
jgi:hypothetical protein